MHIWSLALVKIINTGPRLWLVILILKSRRDTGLGMRWRTFVVICPRSVGSLTTSEDVFILRFHPWLMLSLIHRAGPRRLIGQRAGPAPYRELDYNWWEFDNNNLLYIYTMCHRNSMGYRHFKSAPSDAARPIMWFAHVSPQQILIFVVIFIAKHFFQFHASQQSFRQKTIVPR